MRDSIEKNFRDEHLRIMVNTTRPAGMMNGLLIGVSRYRCLEFFS
jgi:hypothetical protein